MARDVEFSHPQVQALVRIYDLDAVPADLFVRGMNGGLDFAGLCFGTRYRLIRDLTANRGGALSAGEKVHFLGYRLSERHGDLRLFVERATGEHVRLDFDCTAPEVAGLTGRIHRGADFFAPVRFDLSSRTKKLTAARAVLLHLRKKETGHAG